MSSPEEGWTVGGKGTVLRYNGKTWSVVPSSVESDLYNVTLDNEGRIWAVGSEGVLLRFDGQVLAEVETPNAGALVDVDASDDGEVWVVDRNGIILRRVFLDADVPAPSVPQLKLAESDDGDGDFTVSWEGVPGIAEYILEEADDSMCPVTVYFGTETSKEMHRKDMGTYYYRVSALGIGGRSEWSDIQSVEVRVPPPPCSVDCKHGVAITCESGLATFQSECWDEFVEGQGWTRHCKVTATYAESANVYHFDSVSYRIQASDGSLQERNEVTVTGGVFGNEPQQCQNY